MTRRPLLLLLSAVLAVTSCGPVGGERYSRKQAQKSLQKLEAPGLVIGEFVLTKIVDGDTVKVNGLDSSLRLLGMDTEETFKSEANRRAVETDWTGYLAAKKGKNRPGRIETPTGEVAKEWAKKFFDGTVNVRLERDHPAEIRDRFKRYLAYCFVQKNGTWMNFNVEAVRAGMSPYYTKYGFSRRYHDDFMKAEAEAKAAKRGIWSDGILKYPDYPEREAWWRPRGEFVAAFRAEGAGKDNYIDVTHWDALMKLEKLVGKEVHILGTVDDVRINERGPARVAMDRVPVIFFDRDVLGTSGLIQWKGEYVRITGVPTIYENKNTKRKQVQIVVERASQVQLSQVPGLAVPTTGEGP